MTVITIGLHCIILLHALLAPASSVLQQIRTPWVLLNVVVRGSGPPGGTHGYVFSGVQLLPPVDHITTTENDSIHVLQRWPLTPHMVLDRGGGGLGFGAACRGQREGAKLYISWFWIWSQLWCCLQGAGERELN